MKLPDISVSTECVKSKIRLKICVNSFQKTLNTTEAPAFPLPPHLIDDRVGIVYIPLFIGKYCYSSFTLLSLVHLNKTIRITSNYILKPIHTEASIHFSFYI